MLLRSSSTPILGSLSSSSSTPFNESPSNNHHQILEKAASLPSPSFPHPPKPSVCCHFSLLPDSSSTHDQSAAAGAAGFRRALSDGNLHSLLSSDHKTSPALYAIPSFSVYNSNGEEGERDLDEEGDEESDVIGRGISGGFCFLGQDQNLNLVEDSRDGGSSAFPLFLARGLGIDRIGSGLLNAGGGGGGGLRNGGGGGERSDVEMYYKRMVEENPSNALFLGNYAQFLYQTKGDAQRAEEYYSRAILADPGDGEILSQYARLVWELHHDKERAASYFEQAVRASPNDRFDIPLDSEFFLTREVVGTCLNPECFMVMLLNNSPFISLVLGAYASFLWETGDDDGDGDREDGHSQDYFGVPVRHEVLA